MTLGPNGVSSIDYASTHTPDFAERQLDLGSVESRAHSAVTRTTRVPGARMARISGGSALEHDLRRGESPRWSPQSPAPGRRPPSPRFPFERRRCLHCRLPLATGCTSAFCCRGCEAVHALLADAGLYRYYDLGGGEGHPVAQSTVDHKWLEPIAASPGRTAPGLTRIILDVQGVHCSACVWLLDEIFRRAPSAAGILVNPAVGSVELTIGPDFPLSAT